MADGPEVAMEQRGTNRLTKWGLSFREEKCDGCGEPLLLEPGATVDQFVAATGKTFYLCTVCWRQREQENKPWH